MNAVRPSRRRTAQQWMESRHRGRDGFRRLALPWSRQFSAAPDHGRCCTYPRICQWPTCKRRHRLGRS